MSSEKEGGAGARGIRYEGSVAGTSGDGNEVRLDEPGVSRGLIEATDAGRDGKSCESLSEPEVFCRFRGGREDDAGVSLPTAGEPARRAVGTESTEGFLVVAGEPTLSGEGTSSMFALHAPGSRYELASMSRWSAYAKGRKKASVFSRLQSCLF